MTNGIAYCYARVSTQIQVNDGVSLDAQERTLRMAAELAEFEPKILREEGRSGKSIQGRPLLREALIDLDEGRVDLFENAAAKSLLRLDKYANTIGSNLLVFYPSNNPNVEKGIDLANSSLKEPWNGNWSCKGNGSTLAINLLPSECR